MTAAIPCQHGLPSLNKCDECRKARSAERSLRYYHRNPEKAQQWKAANPEKTRAASRRFREANPERVHEHQRRYREANAEEVRRKARERQRVYDAAHPEEKRDRLRRYYEANPERFAENNRRWREANPEKARATDQRMARTRRARLAGVPSDPTITIAAVWARDMGQCSICHEAVLAPGLLDSRDRWAPTIEHVIPLAVGGHDTWDNVRLAHRHCNGVKGAKRSADEARAIILARPVA